MSELIRIITAQDPDVRNRPLDEVCRQATAAELLAECEALEQFRRKSTNLYENVRALFFLSAIYRYHLPFRPGIREEGSIPFQGCERLLNRRFEEALRAFHAAVRAQGPSVSLASALAAAYRGLAFQTLADRVRLSVRAVRGNQWMFRTGHPADHPLRIRKELLDPGGDGLFPLLRETTPVRMDLTHSGWSDIFFLGMDFPEGARVINTSIDLAIAEPGTETQPEPPVEAWFRMIDEPVLRLASVDLGACAEIRALEEVFDFARDYLGLLKAAVIASGLIPPGLEGATQPLPDVLRHLTGRDNLGIEIVSKVNGIPKGSRLAVSTNLLACLIAVCMRASGQTRSLSGAMEESERRLVAARAILGEWLGGSGGGWQDSGGVWPGIKLISGVVAQPGDVEFGVSRGRLLPQHKILEGAAAPEALRRRLRESLVLVHGGMAQDVGPVLEMVTERYLLRSEAEWRGRQEAISILDDVLQRLGEGDIRGIGALTQRNFDGPVQTIIPWAGNAYTDSLIRQARAEFGEDFWGFWMLGGMAGGGMGFLFAPHVKSRAAARIREILRETKRLMETAVPFAIEPVVYEFAINERGSVAELKRGAGAMMPTGYYTLTVPRLLRSDPRTLSGARRSELGHLGDACRTQPELGGMVQSLVDHLLPRAGEASRESLAQLLSQLGFDRVQHESIRGELRQGRVGLAQNRLSRTSRIENAGPGSIHDARAGLPGSLRRLGRDALAEGAVAVVSLAGGAGSRWTQGAGVVKALNPFIRMDGEYRTFIEVHLAKSRKTSRAYGRPLPHIFTTSYVTHQPVEDWLNRHQYYGYPGPVHLSPGRAVGLRLVPMVRDLRFHWEETAQQQLDEQAQKMRDSLRHALIGWAERAGEGSDYTDNAPGQCLHPVGHWYEIPNLLRNGVLKNLMAERPALRYLMLHNIDTLGTDIDPALLGLHIDRGAALTAEVIARQLEDRGGGLAIVDGRPRLVEGLALPSDELEFSLSYYNTGTMWIDIHRLLAVFGLDAAALADESRVAGAVRDVASRMPAYITLKDVKKRWGKGQEDVYPVAQFEKLWGDMTALSGVKCEFVAVSRMRGQQLKEPAQLDGWLRDGSGGFVRSLCEWR
ncbi:MAG: UTP--glucose-1-phosphate uridylyltransferase [Bryobacterales bacterium]|nr:UTP--glucose-1-phosphate uridylyltransferase [Bryobacterales bacterium]